MALVNIGEDNKNDGFYRYKMPKLQAKIEGRGNGIKTNVVNMVDVAKALARPPSYTTKYFGCVLGAQSKFDDKTGTSTVNGAHDTGTLVKHLEGFIKKYVQCYSCHNPETEIIITKNQMVTLKCAACGFVSDVDMGDKLVNFILNHPPEVKKKKSDKNMRRAEKERIKQGEALDKEGSTKKRPSSETKKKKKSSTGADDDSQGGQTSPGSSGKKEEAEEEDDDDVVWQTDTSKEAAIQRIQEQLSAVTANMVLAPPEEEVEPKSSPSPSPSTNGMSGKAANGDQNGSANGHEEDDDEEAEEAEESAPTEHDLLVDELVDYIQTHKVAEVADFVTKKEVNLDLFLALIPALFNNVSKGFSKEVVKKKVVFEAVVKDEGQQEMLLIALEQFFALKAAAAAKEIALVLKALYDEEVLEEEAIVQWDQSPSKCPGLGSDDAASVRKLSEPFLSWLKEAESDDEE